MMNFNQNKTVAIKTFFKLVGWPLNLAVFRDYVVLVLGSGATRLISSISQLILESTRRSALYRKQVIV